jgi:hypothetical protein
MEKETLLKSLDIITSQFNFVTDAINSAYGPHCDGCGRAMTNEGWLLMGVKKLCGPCMDHAK